MSDGDCGPSCIAIPTDLPETSPNHKDYNFPETISICRYCTVIVVLLVMSCHSSTDWGVSGGFAWSGRRAVYIPTVKSCVQYIREDPFLAAILPYICMIKFTSKLIAKMGSSKMTGFKKDTKIRNEERYKGR